MATLMGRMPGRSGLAVALGLVLVLGTALGYVYAGPLGLGASAGAAQFHGEPARVGALRNPIYIPDLRAQHAPVYTPAQAQALRDKQEAARKQLPGVKLAATPTVREANLGPLPPFAPAQLAKGTATGPAGGSRGATPRAARGDLEPTNSATVSAICSVCSVSSNASESVAADGADLFAVGNTFADISYDNGVHWSALNPYITDPYASADQQVAYEPTRDVFAWLIPAFNGFGSANNHLTLLSMTGGLTSACQWTIQPTDVGLPSGTYMAFPQLDFGTDYAYVSFVAFNAGGWAEAGLARLDLDALASVHSASCAASLPLASYGTTAVHAFTLADGATDTMYFAGGWYEAASGHADYTGGHLRLFFWKESGTTVNVGDLAIDPFVPLAAGAGDCSSEDHVVTNWCASADSALGTGYRSRAGYKGRGSPLLSFAFNAQANPGSGLPYPYVVREYFNLYNVTYSGHENMAFANVAVLYLSMAVAAARSYVGGEVAIGGGTGSNHCYPDYANFFENPDNSGPYGSFKGFCDGYNTVFGDYTVSRAVAPTSTHIISGLWFKCGFKCGGACVVPTFVEFGEARDHYAYLRWAHS